MVHASAAVAQVNVDVSLLAEPFSLLGAAAAAFLTTLVFGALLVAFGPGYVERMTETVAEDPLNSLAWGVFVLLAAGVMTVALSITGIGLVVAIPLVFAVWVTWGFGSAVAFLAVGERLVGTEDGWLKPLAVGSLINGALALSGVGALVSLLVAAAGFGALVGDWLR